MRRATKALVVIFAVSLAAAAAAYANGTAPQRSAKADRTALMQAHSGGTLKLAGEGRRGHARPAGELHAPVLAALPGDVRRPARASPRRAGMAAFNVVPDIAEKMPDPDERREDLDVQDPQGDQVLERQGGHDRDVVASFQRIFKVKSPTSGGFYAGIVGADACLKKPATCTLKGGVSANAAARTVTINLDGARPRVQVQARRPARRRSSRRAAAARTPGRSRFRARARTTSPRTTRTSSSS